MYGLLIITAVILSGIGVIGVMIAIENDLPFMTLIMCVMVASGIIVYTGFINYCNLESDNKIYKKVLMDNGLAGYTSEGVFEIINKED